MLDIRVIKIYEIISKNDRIFSDNRDNWSGDCIKKMRFKGGWPDKKFKQGWH